MKRPALTRRVIAGLAVVASLADSAVSFGHVEGERARTAARAIAYLRALITWYDDKHGTSFELLVPASRILHASQKRAGR